MIHFFFSDCTNNIPLYKVGKKNLQLLSIAAIRTRHLRRIGPWKSLKTTFLRLIDIRQSVDDVLEFKVFLVLEDFGGLHFDFAITTGNNQVQIFIQHVQKALD